MNTSDKKKRMKGIETGLGTKIKEHSPAWSLLETIVESFGKGIRACIIAHVTRGPAMVAVAHSREWEDRSDKELINGLLGNLKPKIEEALPYFQDRMRKKVLVRRK